MRQSEPRKPRCLRGSQKTPKYCRISKKPDYPTEHFALYNVCVTPDYKEILLFEHKKSGLLLTSGGHLDRFPRAYAQVTSSQAELRSAGYYISSLRVCTLTSHDLTVGVLRYKIKTYECCSPRWEPMLLHSP